MGAVIVKVDAGNVFWGRHLNHLGHSIDDNVPKAYSHYLDYTIQVTDSMFETLPHRGKTKPRPPALRLPLGEAGERSETDEGSLSD